MSNWDSLIDEIKAQKPKAVCAVGKLLESLEPEPRMFVISALERRDEISHPALHEALRRRVGDKAPTAYCIGRHRRGQCSCGGTG